MLDIEGAIQLALDGDAILLVGAGFSAGLANAAGQALPTATEFALELSSAADCPGIGDLDAASQLFLEKFSDYHLAALLRERSHVASASVAQESIAAAPWLRVYTTNYDNSFEAACAAVNKSLRPVTIDEDPADLPGNQLWCVHVNGFIGKITNSYIDGQIRLTNASYLTTSFDGNHWSTYFRQDIQAARCLIVVGYSLHDLDIARIIYHSQRASEKAVFVTLPDPEPALRARLRTIGHLLPVGLDFFSNEFVRIGRSYKPRIRPPLFSCLKPLDLKITEAPDRFRDDDVFDLLLRGECKINYLAKQEADVASEAYIIRRTAAAEAADAFLSGRRAVVMHSDLGNGKTVAGLDVAVQLAARGWSIYSLARRRDSLLSELQIATRVPGNKLFVVDDCYSFLEAIFYLARSKQENIHLLLLSRTSRHELRSPALFEKIDSDEVVEMDLNVLLSEDVTRAVVYLDKYGLWGEFAARRESEKRRIIEIDCAGEMQAVLLIILRSPEIKRRFHMLFELLEAKIELKRAIFLALILAVCEKDSDLYTLSELLGVDVFRMADVRRDAVVREFVNLDGNDVRVKSPVVAKELLRQSEEGKFIVETLIIVLRRLNGLSDDREFRRLAYDLVRFGSLERLLPEAAKRDSAIYLYEEIRELPIFNKDPLFWLQYAIARLAFSQYEVAEIYFKQAYAFASARRGFDTFQIDNHYARHLIESRVFGGLPGKFLAFVEADRLLRRQMQEAAGSAYYPFRVARKYGDFYDRCFQELDNNEKKMFLQACENVLRKIDAGGGALAKHRVVTECRSALQKILTDVGAA